MKLFSRLTTIIIALFVFNNAISQEFSTGLTFDEAAYRKVPEMEKPLGFGENLPKVFSLRKYVPKVAHQGQFGTCVGWSSTYYAASIEYARLLKQENQEITTAYAFDPYFTYLNITKESNYFSCSEGTLITNAANHLVAKGVKRFLYNPLECGARIDPSNTLENSPILFSDFTRVIDSKNGADENIANVKQALVDGHPVVIGMALPKSFYLIDTSGLFIPDASEKQFIADYGGHAMAVIGYDDNRHGGTFEIVNSWGEEWGQKGFLYVKYNDFVDFTRMGIQFSTELKKELRTEGCVSGDCLNGYGKFVYADGNVYEGKFTNGERAGYGLYIWSNDATSFGGEWEASQRNGKGIYYDLKGRKITGYWKEDNFVQNEIVINKIISANLKENIAANLPFLSSKELSALIQDSSIVNEITSKLKQGCVWGDCNNGTGLLLAGNYIYIGTFQSGLRHGYGEMRWFGESWGNAYIGNCESNTRTGIGSYKWPNGNMYMGEWKDGKREGIGAFFNTNGETQAGKFINNNFESEGLGFGEVKLDDALEDPKLEVITIENKSTEPKVGSADKKTKSKKKK
jgi:hypothetical protein